MIQMPASFDWLFWGVGLMLAMPALVVLLGELSEWLARRDLLHYKRPLDLIRNSCMLVAFVMILLRYVVGLPATHIANKVVDTVFYIAVLNAALVIFDVLLFESGRQGWQAKMPKLLVELGRLFLVLLGGAFVVSYVWQVDLQGLLAALGVGSLVIGLALQDTFSSLFSGITLISSRQIQPGDMIQLGDLEGQVRAINWRAVSVATRSGDLVVIPNSQIARDKLHMLGADKGWRRMTIELKIAYRHAPEEVKDVLGEALAGCEGLLAEPRPVIAVKSFEDNCIVYDVSYFLAPEALPVAARSEVLSKIWYVTERQGIALLGRVMERSWQPEALKPPVTTPAVIANRLGQLGTFECSPARLAKLCASAKVEVYRRGEVLVARGERGHAYHVILRGAAQATDVKDGVEVPVDAYARGDLVLMKAFFRGGAAPFNVRAASDLEVIVMQIADLEPVLAEDAKLAHEVERILALRDENSTRNLVKAQRGGDAGDNADRLQILKDLFRA